MSYFIEEILNNNDIIEYLKEKGHEPSKSFSERYKYICPFHGPEKDPSFIVYADGEFQNYHCFGCSENGNIINLVSKMENISLKQAILKLGKNINIDDDDVINREADRMEKSKVKKENRSIEDIYYDISIRCYQFSENTNFDKKELEFIEKIYKKIDEVAHALDYETLARIHDDITDKGIPERLSQYRERMKIKEAVNYSK